MLHPRELREIGEAKGRYTIAGLDRWTGPVDWNGGLAEIVPSSHASVQTYTILPAMT